MSVGVRLLWSVKADLNEGARSSRLEEHVKAVKLVDGAAKKVSADTLV